MIKKYLSDNKLLNNVDILLNSFNRPVNLIDKSSLSPNPSLYPTPTKIVQRPQSHSYSVQSLSHLQRNSNLDSMFGG